MAAVRAGRSCTAATRLPSGALNKIGIFAGKETIEGSGSSAKPRQRDHGPGTPATHAEKHALYNTANV